jgi:hypothetical protein
MSLPSDSSTSTPDQLAPNLRQANLLRVALNDLKRDVATASLETGISAEMLNQHLDPMNRLDREIILRTALTLAEKYPLSLRDLIPVDDDAPDGVRITSWVHSKNTSRTLTRAGSAYYEYLDTAMSRSAMFRPEYLRMLVHVDNNSPDNPKISWNNGHFLFQLTYFIGEVNYYHEFAGRKYCFAMNDGDAAIGMPYCKHSFASRRPDGENAILALTFGGRILGDAQHELSLLGSDTASRFALGFLTADSLVAAKIRHYADRLSLTMYELAHRTEICAPRLAEILKGKSPITDEERNRISSALIVLPSALMGRTFIGHDIGVFLSEKKDAKSWSFPSRHNPQYVLRELCGTQAVHGAIGLEVRLADQPSSEHGTYSSWIDHGFHEYGYTVGADPVTLIWMHKDQERRRVLDAGDSFYCKPFVKHRFESHETESMCPDRRLILLRIPGKMGPDQLDEAAELGSTAISRLITDTNQWYAQ